MTYPCRFDPMPEPGEPAPHIAREIAALEAAMTAADVPHRFWRYDLPKDGRLDGIRAHNRGVELWNNLPAEMQRRIDSFCRPSA